MGFSDNAKEVINKGKGNGSQGEYQPVATGRFGSAAQKTIDKNNAVNNLSSQDYAAYKSIINRYNLGITSSKNGNTDRAMETWTGVSTDADALIKSLKASGMTDNDDIIKSLQEISSSTSNNLKAVKYSKGVEPVLNSAMAASTNFGTDNGASAIAAIQAQEQAQRAITQAIRDNGGKMTGIEDYIDALSRAGMMGSNVEMMLDATANGITAPSYFSRLKQNEDGSYSRDYTQDYKWQNDMPAGFDIEKTKEDLQSSNPAVVRDALERIREGYAKQYSAGSSAKDAADRELMDVLGYGTSGSLDEAMSKNEQADELLSHYEKMIDEINSYKSTYSSLADKKYNGVYKKTEDGRYLWSGYFDAKEVPAIVEDLNSENYSTRIMALEKINRAVTTNTENRISYVEDLLQRIVQNPESVSDSDIEAILEWLPESANKDNVFAGLKSDNYDDRKTAYDTVINAVKENEIQEHAKYEQLIAREEAADWEDRAKSFKDNGGTIDSSNVKTYQDIFREGSDIINPQTGKTMRQSDVEAADSFAFATKEQRDTYSYLLTHVSEKAAEKYKKDIQKDLNYQRYQVMFNKWAAEDKANPIAHTLAYGLGAVLKSPAGIADLYNSFFNPGAVDEYDRLHDFTNQTEIAAQVIPETLNWTGDAELFGQDLDSWIYGTVYSSLQSASNMAIAGVLPAQYVSSAVSMLMSVEMLSDTIKEAKAKGYSDKEAALISIVRGSIEAATEKWSIERIISSAQLTRGLRGKELWRQIGKTVVKSGVSEGSEELAANILNNVFDIIINAPDNKIAQMEEQIRNGKPAWEAIGDVVKDMVGEDISAVLAGAVSGIAMAGPAIVGNVGSGRISNAADTLINGNRVMNEATANMSDEQIRNLQSGLISDAREAGNDSLIARRAVAAAESGKQLTNRQLYALEKSNADAISRSDEQRIVNGIAEQIKNRDASIDNAEDIARAILNGDEDFLEKYSRNGAVSNVISEVQRGEQEWVKELAKTRTNLAMSNREITAETNADRQYNTTLTLLEKQAGMEYVDKYQEVGIAETGERQNISSVTFDENGKATIYTTSSSKETTARSLNEIDASKSLVALIEGASKYGSMAQAVYDAYVPGQNVKQFLKSADFVTQVGASINNITDEILNYMSGSQLGLGMNKDQVKQLLEVGMQTGNKSRGGANAKLFTKGVSTVTFRAGVESALNERIERLSKGTKLEQTAASQMKASVDMIRELSRITGINFELFESTGKNGKYQGKNGSYNPETNTIELDINAGMNSVEDWAKSAVMTTVSHEVTHWMKQASPAAFADLMTFVIDKLASNGSIRTLDYIIAKQMQRGEEANKNTDTVFTWEMALEEVVADGCQLMLKDSKTLRQFLKENYEAGTTMMDHLRKMLNTIKNAFAGNRAVSNEAKILMKHCAEELQEQFDSTFLAAINSIPSTNILKEDAIKAAKTDSGDSLFSYRTMEEDKEAYREDLQPLIENGIMTEAEVDTLFDTVDFIMAEIEKNDLNRRLFDTNLPSKSESKRIRPYKSNADPHYGMALDFSTICRKRLLQQVIVDRLNVALKRNLSAEDQLVVNKRLRELQKEGRKIELACDLCYVEAARYNSPKWINKFLQSRTDVMNDYFARKAGKWFKQQKIEIAREMGFPIELTKTGKEKLPTKKSMGALAKEFYARTVEARKNYKLTDEQQKAVDIVEDLDSAYFTTADGLLELREEYPEIYDAFAEYIRNHARSKAVETRTEYKRGDIVPYVGVNGQSKNFVTAQNESGTRMQSWSDFEMVHILDHIAAVIELSTRNAKAHTYTKVPAMVRISGNTGIMFNLSLIPKGDTGLDANGNLIFDDTEGMPKADADELRERFHATAGNIVIGCCDEQIIALMKSDKVDYIIPYHVSGMPAVLKSALGMRRWSDYTDTQNGKGKQPGLHEWFDIEEAKKAKNGYEYMEKAADKYLQLCNELGSTPKFWQFLEKDENGNWRKKPGVSDVGYWKLLIDRKMVDQVTGTVIEQQGIRPVFNRGDIEVAMANERADESRKAFSETVEQVCREAMEGKLGFSDDTREMIGDLTRDDVDLVHGIMSYEDDVKFYKRFGIDRAALRTGNKEKLSDVMLSDRDSVTELDKRSQYEIDNDITMGININDSAQPFTSQILSGEKTIETRNTNSLKPYIGKRVALIRTGTGKATVVGYATIGEPVKYNSAEEFNADYDKHQVSADSDYYNGGIKYGYPLIDVVKADTERELNSRGIVSRSIMFDSRTNEEYLDLAERYKNGDKKVEHTMRYLLDSKARDAGYLKQNFYHGTSRFGFTKFDMAQRTASEGMIYATSKREVAANYAGREHYAGVRNINKKLRTMNTAENVLFNAEQVFEQKFTRPDAKTRYDYAFKVHEEFEKIQSIVDDAFDELRNIVGFNTDEYYESPAEDFDLMMSIVYDMCGDDFWTSEEFKETGMMTNDYGEIDNLKRSAEIFEEHHENFRSFLSDNRESIKGTKLERLYDMIMKHRLYDAYVDVKYGVITAITEQDAVSTSKGRWSTVDDLREMVENDSNIGAYQLYIKPGDRVLEIDCNDHDWLSVEFKLSDKEGKEYHSTDTIAKWARENGYSAVLFKNVYDGGIKADEYVLFDNKQVKSADLITYDDNGEIIPLDKRFDSKNEDIRFETREDNVENEDAFEYTNVAGWNIPSSTIYGTLFDNVKNNAKDKEAYFNAKNGDDRSALYIVTKFLSKENLNNIASINEDYLLLPIVGVNGADKNRIPRMIAIFLESYTGKKIKSVILQEKHTSRTSLSTEQRIIAEDSKFTLAKNIKPKDINGKKFLLIDDNTSYGSTFRGASKFLSRYGGEVVGLYALTVGGDSSDQIHVTEKTWNRIKQIGIKQIEQYAKEVGYNDTFDRKTLGEHRAQTLIKSFLLARESNRRRNSGSNGAERERTGKTAGIREKELHPGNEVRNSTRTEESDALSQELELTDTIDSLEANKNTGVEEIEKLERDLKAEQKLADQMYTGRKLAEERRRITEKYENKLAALSKKLDERIMADQMHEGAAIAKAVRENTEQYKRELQKQSDKSLADQMYLGRKIQEEKRILTERYDQKINDLKVSKESAIAAIKEANANSWRNYREKKTATELRHKIRDLQETFKKRLLHPTASVGGHIPAGLRTAAINVLEAVNMDRVEAAKRIAQLEMQMAKETNQEKIVALAKKIANIEKQGNNLHAALSELHTQYQAVAKQDNASGIYSGPVAEMIQNLAESFTGWQEMVEDASDGTAIRSMTLQQLSDTYDVLKALDTTIKNANTLIDSVAKKSRFDVYKNLVRETGRVKKQSDNPIAKFWNKYILTQLRPETAFKTFGGFAKESYWSKMAEDLNRGQLKMTQLQSEWSKFFFNLLNDRKNLKSMQNMVDVGLKDETGNAVKISRGMMLSLYMHLLNEQNRKHVEVGGLNIPSSEAYYKGDREVAYKKANTMVFGIAKDLATLNRQLQEQNEALRNLPEEHSVQDELAIKDKIKELKGKIHELRDDQLAHFNEVFDKISKQLTAYEREWISQARYFEDVASPAALNEATEKLYGFSKARVENYWQIVTDPDYLKGEFQSIVRDASLENVGFMKERIEGSNPILLEDMADVIARQIRSNSQYAGMLIPISNFNKIYNGSSDGNTVSLKKILGQTFGNNATTYIEKLMGDLQGAGNVTPTVWNVETMLSRARGGMAGSALTLSLSTALAQTASYPTAAAEIGWKPLVKALGVVNKMDGSKRVVFAKAEQEAIRKYSPLLWYRMQGYSTTEIGDMQGSRDIAAQINQRARGLTGWIQAMDGMTVGRLWYAAQYYVDEHNKALNKGSDAYYQEVAKVFNGIVEHTQPNYTAMQRPDILRSKSGITKMLTMFMTQRLQNFNIVYDAAGSVARSAHELNVMKKNGASEADIAAFRSDLKSNRKILGRAISSQIVASFAITLAKTVAKFLQHNERPYRDDDGELTAKSIGGEMLDMFLSSLAGNIMFGDALYNLISSKITGDPLYDQFSAAGIDELNNIIAAFADFDLVKNLKDKDLKSIGKDINSLALALSTVLGIPLNNAEKIATGVYEHAVDIANGEFLSFEAGYERSNKQNAHRLFKAFVDGDTAKIAKVTAEFKDTKDADSKIRSYIKEQFDDGEIDAGTASGYLKTMMQHEDNQYSDDDIFWIMDEWTAEKAHEEDDDWRYTKYGEFTDAVLAGSNLDSVIAKYTGHGIDEDKLKSAIGNLKDDYCKATGTARETMRTRVADAYRALGKKEADIESGLLHWDMKADTGYDYSNIREDYVEKQAYDHATVVGYYMTYGGKSAEDAEKAAIRLDAAIETGIYTEDLRESFVDGTINRADTVDYLVTYQAYEKDAAEKKVTKWQMEADTGYSYDDIDDLLKAGTINSSTAKGYFVKYGGYSDDDAQGKVNAINYGAEAGFTGSGTTEANAYYNILKPAGVSAAIWHAAYTTYGNTTSDKKPNGKAITNSKMKKFFAYVNTLNISKEQKKQIALAVGYSESKVRRYAWT